MNYNREHVTVEKAKKFLSRNPSNRNLKPTKVAQYAKAMTAGEWKETHQGIALNCDGSLKDGQHRLQAIVESGCPQWLWVCRGLTDEAMTEVDTGASRSVADAMRVLGHSVTLRDVATGRAMMMSVTMDGGASAPSRAERIAFVLRHAEAIAFAAPMEKSIGGNATARAVVARAWYTRDRERLAEFMEILQSGIARSDEDQAAIAFARAVSQRNIMTTKSARDRVTAYRKTCSCVLAFLERRQLTKIYECSIDPFPIPE